MIVIADTSVLLNLAFLQQEQLLENLFQGAWIPIAVRDEFVRLTASTGRFAGLTLPPQCRMKAVSSVPVLLQTDARLDAGEREALALALEMQAAAVLMDEAAGRAAAAAVGVTAIGTMGILLRAKQQRLIAEIAPLLRVLIVEARFRVSSELIRETLTLAGELPR